MKNKELYSYTWGLGIEHEMHIFHEPKNNNKKRIKDFILFDSYKAVQRIIDEKENTGLDISYDDYQFLKNIPFELSGRMCNNKWVIKAAPVKMPEFITMHPFCSIEKRRDIKSMTSDIVFYKERFYEILMKDKITADLVKNYGALSEYPYGMTRYLKCPTHNNNGKYIFEKDNKKEDILIPEYNGSYHITFTLPYNNKTTDKEFISSHQNFCNQLQWLEPLMLAAYFTGDEYAPGTLKDRVRGSFRVMMIGWGNFAGTDIRLLKKGIGRYAKTPTYWREGLYFKDSDKLEPCFKPSPMAKKENAISSLSSDFRTFGSTDPLNPNQRESGAPMNKPNGVEFRIFDHFCDIYIEHLTLLISLVAENSRVTKTKGYVYQNKYWIKELHNIMINGYKAKLSKNYIKLLRKKLGLEIKTESIIAIDLFEEIFKELWEKNIDGEWSKIFHCLKKPIFNKVLPNVNKKSWQFAFMIKLNRDEELIYKFNFLSNFLNHVKVINYKDFEISSLEIFGNNWYDDIEDLIYFYESLEYNNIEKYVKLIKNKDGTINTINIINKIPKYNNFNIEIRRYFSCSHMLSNYINKL